ncbi:MAG: PH domain-containing protein [Actinomycetota bacterium]|nr:PH domain-containing protein [Actinomycetota bacterium]
MTSTKDLLASHEELIFDLRPHWIELAGAVLWAVVIVAGAAVGAKYAHHWTIWAIAALVLVLWFSGRPVITWLFTHFILSTDRIITRHGMIAKRSREIPLERVNDVTFSQSIFQRLLGAGDIVLESAGERGQEVISNVRHPQKVHLRIYEEMEKNSNRTYGGGQQQAAAPSAPNVTDQIQALAKLRDQGAISEAEYESKKAELLKRL